jgi:hypothetical protein
MKHAVRTTITPVVLAVYFFPISSLVYSSTLKIEAISSCETLAKFYRTTLVHISENCTLHCYCCQTSISLKKLKSLYSEPDKPTFTRYIIPLQYNSSIFLSGVF